MSLFHKLQDVYFDAVNLSEELKQIPPHCDCADAETHLAGRCSCADMHSRKKADKKEADIGCLFHLQKLSKSINWFEEDVRKSREKLRPEDNSFAIEGRLFLIVNLIDNFKRMVSEIESDLTEFRATCAHKALEKVKERSKDLERDIQELNKIL